MTTKTYQQIQKQIETLTRQAEALKRQEIEGVIARIKEAIAAYGLSASDLGLARRSTSAATKPVRRKGRGKGKAGAAVKFRDEAGNTWGGRGPRPRWLREALAAGKQLQDFAV